MTDQQKIFVAAYCGEARFNATEAARIAGYRHPNITADSVKRRPEVAAAIEERLAQETLKSQEVLQLLTQQATGSVGDFVEVYESGVWKFDLNKNKKKLHLVKKLSQTRDSMSIELYDAQAALIALGRHYKLFTDKQEIDATITETAYDDLSDTELDSALNQA